MSTAPIDSGGSGGGINRILAHFSTVYRSNSIGATENPATAVSTTSISANETTDTSWIGTFNRLDRIFSGSLLHLLYRFIDITILLIGLTSNKQTCDVSNQLSITSICLLIFYFIDLIIIILLLIRNIFSRSSQLTEEQKLERLRHASTLRGFFIFFKLIPICVGTAYSFPSSLSNTDECQLMRFCLGLVCFSTWLLILIPPTKPELPMRRSFIVECFILLFVLIINCTYIGTVAIAMQDVQYSTCIYNTPEDLYLGAPLKSYAYIGLILFACTTIIHIINLIISQLCLRLNHGRRIYIYYYSLQYALNYFGAIAVIYYFSFGALFLFQPTSGQPCQVDAPNLYRVLVIWEWIRILSPLIAIPLIIILCCLGVFFGIILSYCLPASITVPLLEVLRVRIKEGYFV
jgi:hypothetical protein